MRSAALLFIGLLLHVAAAAAASAQANAPAVGRFPFLEVDARGKQIRVECEALRVKAPLEFFCCVTGTNEHESVLRSKVKPSHLHAALLMLGLQPGQGVHFDEAAQKWLPPHGPALDISVEFEKDGKTVRVPGYKVMRDARTKKAMPPMTWIFAGSRMIDGRYAADETGYLISVVNFDLTVIDVPELASNANETLEWETDLDAMPAAAGTKVTMIIEPAGHPASAPAPARAATATTQRAGAPAAAVDQTLITVSADGVIRMNDVEYSPKQLSKLIDDLPRGRRTRVAVGNAVEENPAARAVINELARTGTDFIVIPQAVAATRIGHDEKTEQLVGELRQTRQRLLEDAERIQILIDKLNADSSK